MRLVRAGVLTGLVVSLTTVAHRLGGGTDPGPLALIVLTALLWPSALLATRTRLRPALLVAGLGVGQLVGHGLLGWLGGSVDAAGSGGAVVSIDCLQHATHGASSAACATDTLATAATLGGHAHSGSQAGLLMLVAHVAATLLAALLVSRGERVLWHVLDLVVRSLPVLVRPVTRRSPRPATVLLLRVGQDGTVRAGRGPPAYAA